MISTHTFQKTNLSATDAKDWHLQTIMLHAVVQVYFIKNIIQCLLIPVMGHPTLFH